VKKVIAIKNHVCILIGMENMKYTITVIHANKAPEVFDTDDKTFEEALKSAEMFAGIYPDARIQIN